MNRYFTLQIETYPNVWNSVASWSTETAVRKEYIKLSKLHPEDRYRIVKNVGYEKLIYPK